MQLPCVSPAQEAIIATFRLRADVLREAAAERGDPSIRRIVRTTGIDRSVIYRNLKGRSEPSLGTLMRFHACYGIHVEDLVAEAESTVDAN
jgi:DNA-binding phage protein